MTDTVSAQIPTPRPPDAGAAAAGGISGTAGGAGGGADRRQALLESTARWVSAFAGAFVLFGIFLAVKGANPFSVYGHMFRWTLFDSASLQQILVKATPFLLGALAVVVPARAGLVNVGGEGQIIIGAVAAAGFGLAADQHLPGGLMWVFMALAAMGAGAIWAGLAVLLRLTIGINEAVSTLLLNYVALDIMLYLIYEPWKDPSGAGQPTSRPLDSAARLPYIGDSDVHGGILVALAAAALVWVLLTRTTWGFRLKIVGGNAEAARRAGLPVAGLLLSAMLVGGALAGLGGMIHFAGVEDKLRTGMTANFGYIAFLASWLARHRPLPVVGAALLLAAITVAGDSFQIDSGLPAAASNVLLGLLLFAVLGWTTRKKRAA
jgi:ABC-type uncharacterized transport system permease subunit